MPQLQHHHLDTTPTLTQTLSPPLKGAGPMQYLAKIRSEARDFEARPTTLRPLSCSRSRSPLCACLSPAPSPQCGQRGRATRLVLHGPQSSDAPSGQSW